MLAAVYGNTDVQCYVNIHMRSNQEYDHERLLDSIKDMPKNCMLVIEHLPFDFFDDFYDKFSPLRIPHRLGLTFDTAHIYASGKPIDHLIADLRTNPRTHAAEKP